MPEPIGMMDIWRLANTLARQKVSGMLGVGTQPPVAYKNPEPKGILDQYVVDPEAVFTAAAGLFGGPTARGFNAAKAEGRVFSNRADKIQRFEIDDSAARLTDFKVPTRIERANQYLKEVKGTTRQVGDSGLPDDQLREAFQWADSNPPSVKLGDVLEHEELYKNYPEARDINFSVDAARDLRGSFDHKTNTITVGSGNIGDAEGKRLGTTIHEIQHAIQEREGFAKGGSPKRQLLDLSSQRQAIEERIMDLNRQMHGAIGKPRYVELMDERADLVRQLRESKQLDPIDMIETANKQYKNLSGEIEARDAAARMNLTAKERQGMLPYSSENIPLKDWITRGESGTAMSVADDLSALNKNPIQIGSGEWGGEIIHASARNPGKIQITRFTEDGTPAGHLEFDSLKEALLDHPSELRGLSKNLEQAVRPDASLIKYYAEAKKKGGTGQFVYISPYRPISMRGDLGDIYNVNENRVAVIFSDKPLPLDTVERLELQPFKKDALGAALEEHYLNKTKPTK